MKFPHYNVRTARRHERAAAGYTSLRLSNATKELLRAIQAQYPFADIGEIVDRLALEELDRLRAERHDR